MAGQKKIRTVLLSVAGALACLAVLALAAVSLILAKPEEEKASSPARQLLNASPAIEVRDENDLYQLVSAFPAPVMSFMSGSGMTFVSATSSDTAVSGGFGRIASLYWQTADGEPMVLQTIYPPGALSLLEDGFHFTPFSGPQLFGNASVRMENETTVRLHTATDDALYVVILPQSLRGQVSALSRSLQLFTANQQD